jgi:hypothetical protein
MNYKNRLSNYRANQRDAASGDYNNANGNNRRAVGALDPVDRTLSVAIRCIATSASGKARIFGYNISPDESYNTANNTTVTIEESSHEYVKRSSNSSPFRVKGVLYTVSSIAQLSKAITITKQTIAGALDSRKWQPSKYTAPTNFNALQIKTSQLQTVVDGDRRFDVDVLAGATIDMIMEISDKVEIAQALSNKSTIKSIR